MISYSDANEESAKESWNANSRSFALYIGKTVDVYRYRKVGHHSNG